MGRSCSGGTVRNWVSKCDNGRIHHHRPSNPRSWHFVLLQSNRPQNILCARNTTRYTMIGRVKPEELSRAWKTEWRWRIFATTKQYGLVSFVNAVALWSAYWEHWRWRCVWIQLFGRVFPGAPVSWHHLLSGRDTLRGVERRSSEWTRIVGSICTIISTIGSTSISRWMRRPIVTRFLPLSPRTGPHRRVWCGGAEGKARLFHSLHHGIKCCGCVCVRRDCLVSLHVPSYL